MPAGTHAEPLYWVYTYESPHPHRHIFVLLQKAAQTEKPFPSTRHKICRFKMKCLLQDVHTKICNVFFSHDTPGTRHTRTLREIALEAWGTGTPSASSAFGSQAQHELICSSRIPSIHPGRYVNPEIQVADLRIRGRRSTHDTAPSSAPGASR